MKIAHTATNFWANDGVEFNDTYNVTGTPGTDVPVSVNTVNIQSNVSPTGVTFNNTAPLDYTVSSSNGSGILTGALIKNGTGKATITSAKSYAGSTPINAGRINIQNNTALGATSVVNVASGAALEIQGGISVNARPLSLNGAGLTASPAGALRNVSGANTYAGLITLGGSATVQVDAGSLDLTNTGGITGSGFGLTVAGAGTGNLAGRINTGAGSVTKNNAGTWTLSGVNTFTGATAINAGTLIIGGAGQLGSGNYAGAITNDGTLTYSSTANQTLSGVISGAGALVLNGTTGAGPLATQTPTLTISNANSYSGGTTINGGTVRIDTLNAAGLGTGTVTVNGGNFLFGSNMTVANNFVLSGGGIYARDNTNTLNGTLTINAGGTTSYLGERYDRKTLNINGEVFGSGNVTLANVVAPFNVDGNNFRGNNVQFSNTNVSTYNGTVTIVNDGFTTLFLNATNALANATINAGLTHLNPLRQYKYYNLYESYLI